VEVEAEKRGLSNFKTTPEALKARASKQALICF
jgi:glutamine synthetase